MDGEVDVEDLGNINITIREGLGGRGSSGNVGGGPSSGGDGASRELAQVLKQMLRMHEKQVAEAERSAMFAQNSVVATVQAQVRPDVIGQLLEAQQSRLAIADLARRPSAVGALQFLRQGTATSEVLGGLGRTGAALGVGFVALAAVAGTAMLGIEGLRRASEHAASRIENVWKYSAVTAGAMAEQQISKVAMMMDEVRINGATYARTIRQQTQEMIAQAKFNTELAKTTNVLSRTFSRLKVGALNIGTEALKSGDIYRAFGVTGLGVQAGMMSLEAMDMPKNYKQRIMSQLTWWQHIEGALTLLIGGEKAAKALAQSQLAEIIRNTRKETPAAMNDWFEADIKVITGLPV